MSIATQMVIDTAKKYGWEDLGEGRIQVPGSVDTLRVQDSTLYPEKVVISSRISAVVINPEEAVEVFAEVFG